MWGKIICIYKITGKNGQFNDQYEILSCTITLRSLSLSNYEIYQRGRESRVADTVLILLIAHLIRPPGSIPGVGWVRRNQTKNWSGYILFWNLYYFKIDKKKLAYKNKFHSWYYHAMMILSRFINFVFLRHFNNAGNFYRFNCSHNIYIRIYIYWNYMIIIYSSIRKKFNSTHENKNFILDNNWQ